MKKKITVLLFILTLLLTARTKPAEEPAQEPSEEPAQDLVEDAFAKRFETEKPWIDSNVFGTVRDSGYDPDLKGDFYVAANHDWMVSSQLRPGYTSDSSFDDRSFELKNELKAIIADEDPESEDGRIVSNLYHLWLGWDQRNSIDYQSEILKHTETKEKIDVRILSDPHALACLRVNAVLQQFEEFHETYSIKEGDGMYLAPEDRVAV